MIMAKRRSTERTLDDWLNGPVTQRIRTVSDNSTSDNVEDKDQEPRPSHSQEPCTIVISSSDDGETDDEIEGDSCPETDCSESETLFTPSARSSPAVPVPIEELDDSITVQDCHGTCCKVDMNSAFQPQDKETLGSFAKGGRNFMCKWYKVHPWLTVCEERKKAFCFYCKYATNHGLLTFSKKAENTFSTGGFNNWRKALKKFASHEASDAHREAVMKWKIIQQPSIDVQFNSQMSTLRASCRQGLLKQLRALQYLLRQGIAIRGHTEVEGNLYQLLKVWANDNSDITHWLSERKYMSHDIVTEQITLMGNTLLRSLLQNIKQSSPAWYAIMGDEASDIANREQLNISIRWVNESYEISEDPVGLFCLTNTTADAICDAIKDILIRCSLPLSLCRGQAYDGASNMQGCRKGVATQIKHESPSALSVHCFAHRLNLCLQDVGKQLVFLRDALEVVREIAKLIKFSPKRASLFSQVLVQPDNTGVTIKPLCLTRWTARHVAIEAVLKDYKILLETLEEINQTTHDEYGMKAGGI